MEKITLFHLEREDIKIKMELYFNNEDQLFFDGYDCGAFCKKAWGDSDYEYTHTIDPEEVKKFYPLFNLKSGDRAGLLQSLKDRFSVNNAYSLFAEFMKANDIKHVSFTWT